MTTGPSGNPRPDASRVAFIGSLFLRPPDPPSRSDERPVLEVELRQRLTHGRRGVAGDLGAVGVERVDERRDNVAALVEVELLHLVLELLARRLVERRVRLLVETIERGVVGVRLVE